jgi:hypothetical protein
MKSRLFIYVALAADLAIAITKFFGAALTGSSAMISEGIHSIIDSGGTRRSRAPADNSVQQRLENTGDYGGNTTGYKTHSGKISACKTNIY